MRKRFIAHLAQALTLIIIFAVVFIVIKARQIRITHPTDSVESRMVFLKRGRFLMGTASGGKQFHHLLKTGASTASVKDPAHGIDDEDERPAHRIALSAFYIDATEVKNAEFARFVEATGYKTDAEKSGSSWVFKEGVNDWELIQGADWRHPLGPDSSITDKMNHPVVKVSWNDAAAYAKWAVNLCMSHTHFMGVVSKARQSSAEQASGCLALAVLKRWKENLTPSSFAQSITLMLSN